ncbi:hypothetical protein [Dactylosporangium sp. NPDC048998]|uniref:hypothetical protein n=1 Tax=Dactylosporangium sp. NPDC048998 TaxID=3363976 RepID=UPI003710D4C1
MSCHWYGLGASTSSVTALAATPVHQPPVTRRASTATSTVNAISIGSMGRRSSRTLASMPVTQLVAASSG